MEGKEVSQHALINVFPQREGGGITAGESDDFENFLFYNLHLNSYFVSEIPWMGFKFFTNFQLKLSKIPLGLSNISVVCRTPKDRDAFAVLSSGYPCYLLLEKNVDSC